MGRTVVGHPSQSGNVVTFPLLLALIADASSASSSWSFPSLSAAPASRSGGRVARREFLPNGRYSIHTCRPRHVVSTAALAEEESLESTAHPSSLRGTADVRITIYVAAFEQLLPTRGNHRLQSPGYWCPPRARSSVCRQIVSGKNSRLSHVRPEMQSFGTHSLAATRRIPPARRRQRQDPLSAKGCVNPLRKARRCRRGFIGDRVAGSVPAPDPESLRDRGQKARSTRGTRRRSSNPSRTAASRESPPVWWRRPSNRTERAATCAAGACGASRGHRLTTGSLRQVFLLARYGPTPFVVASGHRPWIETPRSLLRGALISLRRQSH